VPNRRRSALPTPESPQRRLLIRSVALLAIAVSLAYLGWRALFTLNLEGWYLSIPLWILAGLSIVVWVTFRGDRIELTVDQVKHLLFTLRDSLRE
jgi:hypothetical protein